MGGSGGGDSSGDQTYHFSPYLEQRHTALIDLGTAYQNKLLDEAYVSGSPYAGITVADNDYWFLGALNLAVTPVYELFNNLMGKNDIQALYTTIYNDMVSGPAISSLISAHSSSLQDDIDQNTMPKVTTGMRDMNAVMSSSFISAAALVQAQKTKTLSSFSATVQGRAMELAMQRWSKSVEWNIQTFDTYLKFTQLYWQTKFDYLNTKGEIESRNVLWPFTILDHQRALVGALNGAGGAQVKGDSKKANAIGGALAGAASGAMVGSAFGPWGAAIGGVAGGILGFAGSGGF
jgi:hypothetical protein